MAAADVLPSADPTPSHLSDVPQEPDNERVLGTSTADQAVWLSGFRIPPCKPLAVSMTCVQVRRLTGEAIVLHLTVEEMNEIVLIRHLKPRLALASSSTPADSFAAKLIGTDGVEIRDDDHVDWELFGQGLLQYVVVDFVQFMLGDLNFEQFPHLDFAQDPHKMLQPRLALFDAHKVFVRRGRDASACQYFYDAWEAAIMSLGPARANVVEADGGTVLGRMLALLQEALTLDRNPFWDPDIDGPDGQWVGDDFLEISEHAIVTTVIRFVTEKLQVQTVEQTFQPHQDELKSLLWRFVQHKLSLPRGAGHHPGLLEGRGATLMLALIEKGLPRWYWGGCHGFGRFGDNLLQYILESTCHPLVIEQTEAEGFLCLALAERYTLEDFFHQTAAGCISLEYAEAITDRITARMESGGYLGDSDLRVWFEVSTKIKEQMQSRVGEFKGSLLDFAALTRSVRAALRGQSLPAFDRELWQRAAVVRLEWMRMGWRFTRQTVDEQILEVVSWHLAQTRMAEFELRTGHHETLDS
ncbi:unnamed protein product [Symbiodinium sp. CCMP2456]|nr:unnamed protein product [Symbiodinium sp. CCMP2456]